MFSKKMSSPAASLTVRLAGAFALVVGLCMLITFSTVYAAMVSSVRHRVDARLLHEVNEVASIVRLRGAGEIREALVQFAQGEGTELVFYRLLNTGGVPVVETDGSSWKSLAVDPIAHKAAARSEVVFQSVAADPAGDDARVIYAAISPEMVLQAALRTADEFQPIHDLGRLFITVGALAMAISIAVGWAIGKRMLAPLHAMTQTTLSIAAGDFDARLEPCSQDLELAHLAEAFNMMLDRIQGFVHELREMNDSLAHDLRTVFARIHLAAERLLATRPVTAEQESLAASILEESTELLGMLDTIMDLSEMNTGLARTGFADVDITAMLDDLVDFFALTAKDKNVDIAFESSPHVIVKGDGGRLRRAFANILDNAVKYTRPGGRVAVRVTDTRDAVSVIVHDTGIGIAAADQPLIFDRFYRADKSRSTDGHGLGLSLAGAIVHFHGGSIHVQSSEGAGSTFSIHLPHPDAKPM